MGSRVFAVLSMGILLPASLLSAQIAATDTAEAGPDFPFHGEFLGEVTAAGQKWTLAAQVSAYGSGSFRAVLYAGGFPGANGHDAASRVQIMGTRGGDKVSFSGSGYALSMTTKALSGTGPSQSTVSLAKVLRKSPTLGLKPPSDAVVLFDGKDVSLFRAGAKVDSRGLLAVPATTAATYGNYSLHLEVLLPFQPADRGQARANSGIIMNTGGFSEVQVLDSFGDVPYQDGCGALFGTAAPLVHANLPPLTWQTYDINFTAPATTTTGDAVITVRINGVVVQNKTVLKNRRSSTTIEFQDHTDPVFYRNIWLVKRSDYDFAQHGTTVIAVPHGGRPASRTKGAALLSGALEGGTAFPGPRILWDGMVLDLAGRRDARPALPAAP